MSELPEAGPCPMCGDSATLEKDKDHNTWGVFCDNEWNCGVHVDGWAFAETALAAWNRRAPLPTIPHNGTINATEKADG